MTRSGLKDATLPGPASSLAQRARPNFPRAFTSGILSKNGTRKASQVTPAVPDDTRQPRMTHSLGRSSSSTTPFDPSVMRRGSFTGTIPVPSHVPPRLGSVGRLSSTSSMRNNRASGGQTSHHDGKPPPPLRKQRSALASQSGPPGPRLRLVIWLAQFYHNYKRPLGFILDPPLLDPRSNEKLAWDAFVMVAVLYSAIIVPVQMGFPEIQLGNAARAIAVSSDVLFFLDMMHNFFVGYYTDDDENMVRNRRLISKRYLASWFLPDVLAFIPLDYFLETTTTTSALTRTSDESVSSNNAQVLSLRLTRLIRLLRITKLTRLIKLRHFAAKVEDAFDLDAVLARLTRLIGQVLLVTHIFSCFWHLIGFTTEDQGITWMLNADVRDKSVSERYVYSFYWVVATLCGVGYGDIHATNQAERVFAMGVSIVGASGYGLIIGSLTKILENWHRETTTRARKLSMIQAFVRKKRLPRKLKVRLMRYFRHYIAKTSAFDERELLCEFSLSLRGEILHETYRTTFFRIPAFKRLSTQFVLDMAMFIKPLIVVKGDILAREGCMGTEMFILNTGIVEVRRTSTENTDWIVVLEVLTERAVFGEASLLQYAPHINSFTAKATSDLFTLPKEDFDRLIEEFPDAERALFDYHQERSTMYDLVFEQTLARYRVYIVSQNNDPVSGVAGLENLYPTLTVLLDGVLRSYRSLPLPVLQALDLQLSMGVSVFNSSTERMNMIWLLSQDAKAGNAKSVWQHVKWQILTPINPFHWSKLVWDVFNTMLLVYCAFAVPYEAAFLGQDGATLSAEMDVIVEITFLLDIVANLRTAKVVDLSGQGHSPVLERRTRWRDYLRGWFWMDLLSALPIPAIVAVSDESIQSTGGSVSWGLTLVHSLRLFKLARVFKFIHTLQREESSTALGATISSHHTIARVVRLVFRVGFIAHVLACGYFTVARISRSADGGAGVQASFSSEQNSNGEMYVYFLYWAMTTMTTVGYGDTAPLNVAEVAYVSCGVLVGASTFTYVVGTLSSVVEELNEASDTFRERMDHLKAYLRERKISQPLAERLRRYYEYYLLQRDDEHEETILAALSDDLRSQLVLHLNRDVVSKIGFFATQDDACVSYLMGILDPEFCTPGEYVFKEGQVGRHMYFLVKGAAEVVFKAGTNEEQVVATLLEGSYFGEIAMLTRSKRAASIRAKTYMSLFVLSLHGLDRISMHYPEMAHNIIQEFLNKITHIKLTSVKQLGSLVQEDIKQARERSGLLAASTQGGSGKVNTGHSGGDSDLRETLGEFESILSRIVGIYGGGDRGKRKALACVMQYLHKYEFSIDDFLHAAEELNYGSVQPAAAKIAGYSTPASAVLNRLQIRMRRRSSFS